MFNFSQLGMRKPEISTYQGGLEVASFLALPTGLTKLSLLSPPPPLLFTSLDACLPVLCSHKAVWEGVLNFLNKHGECVNTGFIALQSAEGELA